MTTIIGILFIIVCLLLILIVLLQRGRGGGLSGAFGGAGGHSAFGAKTGDVFTWITVGMVALFLLLSVIANWVFVPERFESAPAAKAPTTQSAAKTPVATKSAAQPGPVTPKPAQAPVKH
jgi:preprotein translocase subunit SecG